MTGGKCRGIRGPHNKDISVSASEYIYKITIVSFVTSDRIPLLDSMSANSAKLFSWDSFANAS